jgi:predicted ATPase
MSTINPIKRLTIKGFKSIQRLDRLRLDSLNVLIGANGAGKSNFVSYFRMLGEIVESRLQKWTTNQGSADRIVSFGVKETTTVESFIEFGLNGYKFELEPTVDGGFSFANELLFFDGPLYGEQWSQLGSGHKESKLKERFSLANKGAVPDYCYSSISSWKVFHFHDTSETAGVKRLGSLHDNEYLRPDASNLAAFLYKLLHESPDVFDQIVKTIRLAIPFFDNFVLKPTTLMTQEE